MKRCATLPSVLLARKCPTVALLVRGWHRDLSVSQGFSARSHTDRDPSRHQEGRLSTVGDFVAAVAQGIHPFQSNSKGKGQRLCYESIAGHRSQWISVRTGIGFGHSGLLQSGHHPTSNNAALQARLVRPDGFFNLRADAQHGIQRSHGFLKNHGDARSGPAYSSSIAS